MEDFPAITWYVRKRGLALEKRNSRASNKIHPSIKLEKISESSFALKQQAKSDALAGVKYLRVKDFIKHKTCLKNYTLVVYSDEN